MSVEYRTFTIAINLLKREMTKGHCLKLAASLRFKPDSDLEGLDVSQFLEEVAERISKSSDFYSAFVDELRRITMFRSTLKRVERFHDITSIISKVDDLKRHIYSQLIKEASVDSFKKLLRMHRLPEKWIEELRRTDSLPCIRGYSHRQRVLHKFWTKLSSHITVTEYNFLEIIINEINELQKPRLRSNLTGAFNTLRNQAIALMEKASIKELTGYPLDQTTDTGDFDFIEIKIGIQASPTLHTLKDLYMLKSEYCETMHLPSNLFILTSLEETSHTVAHSHFITVWKLPTMFAPEFIQRTIALDDSYYSSRRIVSIEGPREFRRNIKPMIASTCQRICTFKTAIYAMYVCFVMLVVLTVLCGVYDYGKYIDHRMEQDRALSGAMEYSELKKVDLLKALIKAEKDCYYITFFLILAFVLTLFFLVIACLRNIIAYKNSYAENEQQLQVLLAAIKHCKVLDQALATHQAIEE